MFGRALREPLLHFLVAGALLFAIFGGKQTVLDQSDKEIVVTGADIERLAAMFQRTWNRPPAERELRNWVEQYVREEVLYRSALSLGLDKDDSIIRRRLRQKMDFLFEDTVAPPQDVELRAFFEAHQGKFRTETLISFQQAFINAKHHEDPEADAQRLLERLQSGDAQADGDSMLLAEGYRQTPISRIAELFGDDFARQLSTIHPGRWGGPIKSSFGLHLVRVIEMDDARLPTFEAVRDVVLREWFAQNRATALDEQYQRLRTNYNVRIDYPSDMAPQ